MPRRHCTPGLSALTSTAQKAYILCVSNGKLAVALNSGNAVPFNHAAQQHSRSPRLAKVWVRISSKNAMSRLEFAFGVALRLKVAESLATAFSGSTVAIERGWVGWLTIR